MKRLLLVALVILDLPLMQARVTPAAAQDKPAFVFTAIPDQDATRLVERFTRDQAAP